MQNQNRKNLLLQLFIQTVILVLYALFFVNILLSKSSVDGFEGVKEVAVKYTPFLIILIASLFPEFSLLIKHKLHSQDGEIILFLFTITSLQASLIAQDGFSAMGYYFDYPLQLLVLQRFSLIATAAIFLLSSLRYYGFSSSHMGVYNFVFLAFSFSISILIPVSTYKTELTITSSLYEIYLQLAVLLIYVAAIATLVIIEFKDKTALNIKRSIAFISLAIGIYVYPFNTLWTSIISPVFYIVGAVILVIDAGDSL